MLVPWSVVSWYPGSVPLDLTLRRGGRHWSWTILMLVPWSVVSWYPGSVPLDSTLRRGGRIA
jgi:hypothetical protein